MAKRQSESGSSGGARPLKTNEAGAVIENVRGLHVVAPLASEVRALVRE